MWNSRRAAARSVAIAIAAVFCGCSPNVATEDEAAGACHLDAGDVGTFVDVPTGSFIKGASPIYPEESPSLRIQVSKFSIQAHEVTNAQFEAFVDATGYVTQAEQGVLEGRPDAGSAVFRHPGERPVTPAPWVLLPGATWKSPEGPGSSITGLDLWPVVHVTKRDAEAYAEWAGARLPSEIEWEYAASLGLPDPEDQFSGAFGVTGPRANTWQGVFPIADTGDDGFTGASAVGCFAPDRSGLHDMIGNVWEWTTTPFNEGTHTLKGGSYLCADNYCRRYRPAARHPQETDFSSNHIGFRVVRDSQQNQ